IGEYEIEVSVAAAAQPAYAPAARDASGFDSDPYAGASGSVDPLDFFGEPSPKPQNRVAPPATEPDHTPPAADFFAAPAVRPEARPGAAAGAGPGDVPGSEPRDTPPLIPENWDQTGFSAPDSAAPPPPDESFFGPGAAAGAFADEPAPGAPDFGSTLPGAVSPERPLPGAPSPE